LAGTAVEAFARNQYYGVKRPVWFVPATINYSLVMEAETLIEDHLKESGQARYIIEDDEFSRLDRWVTFFRKLVGTEGACIIRFGRPLDPFGNPVGDDGASIAPGGKRVDPATYVMRRPADDRSAPRRRGAQLGDAIQVCRANRAHDRALRACSAASCARRRASISAACASAVSLHARRRAREGHRRDARSRLEPSDEARCA
jgi:glycerol-3-phosphate O-acyltransferase